MATEEQAQWFVDFWEEAPGFGDEEKLPVTTDIDPSTGVATVQFQLPITREYLDDASGERAAEEIDRTVTAWYNPETTELGVAFAVEAQENAIGLHTSVAIPHVEKLLLC